MLFQERERSNSFSFYSLLNNLVFLITSAARFLLLLVSNGFLNIFLPGFIIVNHYKYCCYDYFINVILLTVRSSY